jgi:hypothetical protein
MLGTMLLMIHLILAVLQPWELRKDQNGIKVYTRSLDSSALDEFRGVIEIDVPMQQVYYTIRDVDNWYQWVPNLVTGRLITRTENEQFHYTETKAPFPVQNRDSYLRYHIEVLDQRIQLNFDAVPDHGPRVPGVTRVPMATGYWLIERINDQSTRITYQVLADPGGSIPSWLANAGAVDTPYDTLAGLQKYLTE